MAGRLVTIGASAGGVEALVALVRQLPDGLQAAVVIAVHSPPSGRSMLARILARNTPLPVAPASHGDQLHAGRIYLAVPDRHLLVDDGRLLLVHGPRENGARPAIDALMRTAAASHGERVIGVVLSGALYDGAAGLRDIKQAGGVAMVQDPAEALFPSMPESALEATSVDHCLSASAIGQLIGELAGTSQEGEEQAMSLEGRSSRRRDPLLATQDPAVDPDGTPSKISCPECGGVLWENGNNGDPGFRCRVGHAYSVEALNAAQQNGAEDAMWAAVRSLEEQGIIAGRLRSRAEEAGHERAVSRFSEQAEVAWHHASTIRELIYGLRQTNGAPAESAPVEAASD